MVNHMATLTIEDVIVNCELAYELAGKLPSAIKTAAERMLEEHKPSASSHAGQLLNAIVSAVSPRIYLNAVVLKLRYLENPSVEYQEEPAA